MEIESASKRIKMEDIETLYKEYKNLHNEYNVNDYELLPFISLNKFKKSIETRINELKLKIQEEKERNEKLSSKEKEDKESYVFFFQCNVFQDIRELKSLNIQTKFISDKDAVNEFNELENKIKTIANEANIALQKIQEYKQTNNLI